MNAPASPGPDRPSRPAREQFPQTASGARSDMEAVEMLNLIDSLRAELIVARQDADRLYSTARAFKEVALIRGELAPSAAAWKSLMWALTAHAALVSGRLTGIPWCDRTPGCFGVAGHDGRCGVAGRPET